MIISVKISQSVTLPMEIVIKLQKILMILIQVKVHHVILIMIALMEKVNFNQI